MAAALTSCALLTKATSTITKPGSAKPSAALKPGDSVISGKPAGFYSSKPKKDQKPEIELKARTRVTLVKQAGNYSLVKLEDKSVGYVATGSLSAAPAKADRKKPQKPAKPSATPEKKPEAGPEAEKPSVAPTPTPEPQVEPSSTPAPDVPQFRY